MQMMTSRVGGSYCTGFIYLCRDPTVSLQWSPRLQLVFKYDCFREGGVKEGK